MESYAAGATIADKYMVTSTSQGGMGDILFCLDTKAMRQVVLKSYRDDFDAAAFGDRFALEAQNWVRLGKNANILQALEAFERHGRLFVAAEFGV